MVQTVYEVTTAGLAHTPAIGAPGRPWLSYGDLKKLVDGTLATLNGAGVGRDDRVALVLPNGPEMASCFIAVASGMAAAPLDPAGSADAFELHLAELKPRAVIVQKGTTSSVRAAARKAEVPVIELIPTTGGPAGLFTLDTSALVPAKARKAGPLRGIEAALVLHAPDATTQPRIVPLSAANLAASARNIGGALALKPRDRCLNIMPLFQVHGLVAAVLSSLGSGASVSCCPDFDAAAFFAWLDEAKPTWYTAAPGIHQAILAQAGRKAESARAANLRFIRSSSSTSMPLQILQGLESAFGCPVIEAYGMTEASHQISSNALPPGKRKPGSVGPAAGPTVAIMDEEGNLAPQGATGEVVIQGRNVTAGYDGDPDDALKAFTEDGWFRTGDLGHLDEDGYLFLTGRRAEVEGTTPDAAGRVVARAS